MSAYILGTKPNYREFYENKILEDPDAMKMGTNVDLRVLGPKFVVRT